VVALVALLIHLVPGDPVDSILGPYALKQDRDALRQALGLDVGIVEQLTRYYGQIFRGSLGDSLIYQKPVLSLIAERFQPTLELAICALLVSIVVSLPLGIISAIYAGRFIDTLAMGIALVGVSIPTFWMGPLLILLFSLQLEWLPVSERGGWSSYILPSLSMGIALAGVLSRMTRTAMLDVMKEDYVRTARSKGLTEKVVILKHVLRNAALPLITIVGLQFGVLLTGAIITERIFDWPGLGSLILEGINNRDYPVVQGCVLLFSMTYLMVNLLTDLTYALVDPRIKIES
jgi:peptide/nickel transport system permease protein